MLHKHNDELYERVSAYIHNQSEENAIALVEWCQREGGKFTGFYPTNYVSLDDVEARVEDEEIYADTSGFKALSHEDMKDLAETMGEIDTESGTYWEAIKIWYENHIEERLEYLRGEIRAERISYEEVAELQALAEHIKDGDVELLEWAGVKE